MAIAGSEYRIDGGSPVDMGTTKPYTITGLSPNTSYDIEVRHYDDATPTPNYSAWSSVLTASTESRLFDAFSTTHLGVWDTRRRLSAYAGPAFRVKRAADNVEQDIGFTALDVVDMAAYAAFGTGTEPVIRIYDQSGNGWHMDIPSADGCILRTSSYNGEPCWYNPNGTGSITGTWTDWNGLADVNLYVVQRPVSTLDNGQAWRGTAFGGHYAYQVGGDANRYIDFVQWFGPVSARFYSQIYRSGLIHRYQYDGGGATAADRLKLHRNGVLQTAFSRTGTPATTWENETGLGHNGAAGSTEYLDTEHFAFYYIGYQLTGGEETAIHDALHNDLFSFTDSNIVFEGDSQFTGFFYSGDPIGTKVKPLLEAETGTTWNTRTVAATGTTFAAFITQDGLSQVDDYRDEWKVNDIALLWAGTNDLYAGGTGADALTNTVNWLTARAAKGFTNLYVLTMLKRTDPGVDAGYETQRAIFNSGLAAAVSGLATVIDVAALPELADPTDTNYFTGDNVHINEAAADLIAQEIFDAIQPDV